MKTIALRYLAEINPPSHEFDAIPADGEVLFLPLEAVWSDDRADQTRRAPKCTVDSGYTRFQQGDTVCPKVTPTFQAARSMRTMSVGAGTTELHVLRPRTNVDPRWITYAVRSRHFIEEGVTAFQGVAGLQRVPPEFVANFRVVDIPAEEQRRIADFLDDRVARIDQIIAARRAQSALFDELLLERMRSAVAGAFEPNEPSATGQLPWVSRMSLEAVVLPLARVVTLQRGVDLTDEQRRPGTVPVITTAGVVGMHDTAVMHGPGVVIGRYGSVGNVHWVDGSYWPHNTTLYVKDRRENDLRWLYYLLRTFPYAAMQARAAIPGVNRNDMATELVPWIPLPQQEASVRWMNHYATEHKSQRSALTLSVERFTEYKQSLITAAVTGELDVTTADSGIPK